MAKRKMYTTQYKNAAIADAIANGNVAAGKSRSINSGMVGRWVHEAEEKAAQKAAKAAGGSAAPGKPAKSASKAPGTVRAARDPELRASIEDALNSDIEDLTRTIERLKVENAKLKVDFQIVKQALVLLAV